MIQANLCYNGYNYLNIRWYGKYAVSGISGL